MKVHGGLTNNKKRMFLDRITGARTERLGGQRLADVHARMWRLKGLNLDSLNKYIQTEQENTKRKVNNAFQSGNRRTIEDLTKDDIIQYLESKSRKWRAQATSLLRHMESEGVQKETEKHMRLKAEEESKFEVQFREDMRTNPEAYGEENEDSGSNEIDLS